MIFSELIDENKPLVIAGTVNAYSAMQANLQGIKALYVSGAGVANASFGVPDLAITSLHDVANDVSRITDAVQTPVLVDIDTGFGSAFNISKTVKTMIKSGAKAIHMEDQVSQKRCGHRPNKEIVSTQEMLDRLKSALDARGSSDLFVIARTDAAAVEGFESALDRAEAYAQEGVDAIFAEAVTDLSQYQQYKQRCKVPILANMTEFGKTPYSTAQELGNAGADMVLYPLSAFRAMSKAAEQVYQALAQDQQASVLSTMQTRQELYETLNYHQYEEKLNELFSQQKLKTNQK